MTAPQRATLVNAARSMAADVQNGDVQTLRTNTIPAVAANFAGIADSVTALKPLVQHATLTIDNLYLLDASSDPAGAPQTSFYCGSPVVVMNFNNLPPAKYALAILHATGVPKPQTISLILSETTPNHWMLAGFFSKPMTEMGHDGLWYWEQARGFAQKKMNWNAWFFYQTAASLLDPVPFIDSPNLTKLEGEASRVRPSDLPGPTPMTLSVDGSIFEITSASVTTELGAFDLEVHYTPNPSQLAQLRDPVAARKQAIDLMAALLARHPGLRSAFHGIWMRADQGNASVYALELPMNQIPGGAQPAASSSPVAH